MVALDADTGKLKWYYQFTPHDEFDYDAVQVPVLADIEWQGQPRKVMLWANRNGFFYVLGSHHRQVPDWASRSSTVNWAKGFDEAGRPMRVPGIEPTPEGTSEFTPAIRAPPTGIRRPSARAPACSTFRPGTIFVGIREGSQPNTTEGQALSSAHRRGRWSAAAGRGGSIPRKEDEGYGAVRAIDPKTGEQKWEFKMMDVTDAGILTTASDLLFSGGREGYFYALDARSGELLWKANVGGAVASGPMSYAVDGKQYFAISAGSSLFVYGLRE